MEFVLDGQPYVTWNMALTRLYIGPAMIEFLFGAVVLMVNLTIQILQFFFYENFNGYVFPLLFKINIAS